MTRRLDAWWVGAPARDEWAEQHRWLQSRADVRAFANLGEVCEALRDGSSADLLVVAQSRPGEIAPDAIESLRRSAPLLPIVQLAGSWCEGELRSGRPWRAAERVYWHQALPQWRADLARYEDRRTPDWMLPLTTTEDERLLAKLATAATSGGSLMSENRVVIAAGSYAMRQWLSDGSRVRGFHPIRWQDRESAMSAAPLVAGLWDGNSLAARADREARTNLADFVGQLAPVPVVALLNFPRIDDLEEARNAGVRHVISKPCMIDDLFVCLDRVVEPV